MKYLVKSNSLLLRYLLDNVKGKSKNNIKSILKNGCVSVNGKIITRYDYELKSGDVIIVLIIIMVMIINLIYYMRIII